MDKFKRSFLLRVQKNDGGVLEIRPPFTIEIDLKRATLASSGEGSIRIYNLNQDNRSQLRKDVWNTDLIKDVELYAGYEFDMPLVFKGNVSQGWSVRQGVDVITELAVYSSAFVNTVAMTSNQYPAGVDQQSVLVSLADSLKKYGVKRGAIGNFARTLARGSSYSGGTFNILDELTGGACFIDNGEIHCLNDNECIAGEPLVISAESGLLGTPTREVEYINFSMIFEPKIILGQRIILEDAFDPTFNNLYLVKSIHHRGIISDSVAGSITTSVGCSPGTYTPVERPR